MYRNTTRRRYTRGAQHTASDDGDGHDARQHRAQHGYAGDHGLLSFGAGILVKHLR